MNEIDGILGNIGDGDKRAASDLLPLVYDELKKLARIRMNNENPGQTLTATALVHEAFLRLVKTGDLAQWDSKDHFFAAAAIAMRRILVEIARRKRRLKYGGGRQCVDIVSLPLECRFGEPDWASDLIDLDAALTELESVRPQTAELVKLRYFAGLGIDDAASAMKISERTAHRYWRFAKAWLFDRLQV